MRQIADLLVLVSLIAILVAVVHFTPKLAQYVSPDDRPASSTISAHHVAFHPFDSGERSN